MYAHIYIYFLFLNHGVTFSVSVRPFQYIANNKNLVPFYVMDVAGKLPFVNSLLITGMTGTALR